MVELDLEPGFEVPGNDHRGLRVQNGAPRQAASNGLMDRLRIQSRFDTERQGFSHGGDVEGYDDLVHKLGETAGSNASHMDDRFSHGFEDGKRLIENARFASHHDGQGPLNRTRLPPADR